MKSALVLRSNKDSIFESMKSKLLHLRNNDTISRTNDHLSHTTSFRHNSAIRTPLHSKDSIASIYQHPKTLESKKPANEKVPKSMIMKRDQLNNKSQDLQEKYHGIDWSPSFATSNGFLGKTSLQAKSEFDNIIKDWISTNWINSAPIIQQKPCHILIHDKLLYQNLSLFESVNSIILKKIPEILQKADHDTIELIWKSEMNKLLIDKPEKMSKFQIESNLREIVRNVYLPLVRESDSLSYRVGKLVKDSFLIKKIINSLYFNVKYDNKILSKLKNIENLNERNDITIIKDNELGFIPSLDYINLLKKVNAKNKNSLQSLNVLKYKSVFGNKVNDYKNLQFLKNMLITEKLHFNERFVILTDERSTSLEYFRLLKLFNKTHANLKLKGCVVYLDYTQARKNSEVIDKKKYTGRELYYVVEDFSDIYDIIEVL